MTAKPPEPKGNAGEPPLEVRNRGVCGPRFARMFPGVDVAELLLSGKAVDQRRGVSIACQRVCPVRSACLQWALDTDQDFGAWGGLTQWQRTALRKKTRTASSSSAA